MNDLNKWKAYLQYNGYERSLFITHEFEVPDELYEKMMQAVKDGKPFTDCDFLGQLSSLAYLSFNLEDYLDMENERPDPEDYEEGEDDEDYRDDLDEYNEELECLLDEFCEERFDVYDPTDFELFRESVIGDCYPALAKERDYTEYLTLEENGERIVTYTLTVCFDKDGVIRDVRNLSAEALESECENCSDSAECMPDYDLLSDLLTEKLEEMAEEAEETAEWEAGDEDEENNEDENDEEVDM